MLLSKTVHSVLKDFPPLSRETRERTESHLHDLPDLHDLPVLPPLRETESRPKRELDVKLKYTARLKQALYQSVRQHAGHCTVLYCTVLYCTVLYCTVSMFPFYLLILFLWKLIKEILMF